MEYLIWDASAPSAPSDPHNPFYPNPQASSEEWGFWGFDLRLANSVGKPQLKIIFPDMEHFAACVTPNSKPFLHPPGQAKPERAALGTG